MTVSRTPYTMGQTEFFFFLSTPSFCFKSANKLTEKRGAQRKVWMWRQITSELVDRLNSDDKVKQHVAELETKVFDGKMTSGQAADSVVDVFLNKVKEDRI